MGNTQFQTPNVIILGLDNSGKTTLLYKLLNSSHKLIQHEDINDTDNKILSPKIPKQLIHGTTIGFNVECIGALKITDVGGGSAMRPLWKNYFKNIKGIIFVFDSNDTLRIQLCRNVLHNNILNEKQLKSLPLLIYSNKTDLSKLTDKNQITNMLQLNKIKHRKYSIHCVSAINTNNIFNIDSLLIGYKWLTNQILHIKQPIKSNSQTHTKSMSTGSLFNINMSLWSNTVTPMHSRKTTRSHKQTASIGLFMDKFMKIDHEKNGHGSTKIRPLQTEEIKDESESNLIGEYSKLKLATLKAMECMEDSTLFFFMFGLSGSGKTTIIYHLKYGCFYSVGTHGSYDNVQLFDYNGVNIGIYECDPFRAGKLMKGNIIVKNYENRINGLIFVIDGNDMNRFDEIKTMLTNCILLQKNNNIPLLITVNTRNNSKYISKDELIKKFNCFQNKNVELNINDLDCIKVMYNNIKITNKILKIIITYLPTTEMLQYEDKFEQSIRDCFIHFTNGFTGNGIEYGMNWIISNARKTHSQKLHIALNALSKSQSENDIMDNNEKNDMKFVGDKNETQYGWTVDYLDELMKEENKMEETESIFEHQNVGSITAPIRKAIW
eukprot:242986_1